MSELYDWYFCCTADILFYFSQLYHSVALYLRRTGVTTETDWLI